MAGDAARAVQPTARQGAMVTPPSAGMTLTVALTFDDLPVHATLPPGTTRTEVAKAVVAALGTHHAPPTYGFVNGKALNEGEGHAEVLRIWRAAGHPLGNHTWSHMDLDASTREAFEEDVLGNEAILRDFMRDGDWRWLRFPYLHEGNTPEKRRAVAAFLVSHGYKTAPATITFGDWAYNDPYARCMAVGDRAAIDWMKTRFLQGAGEALTAAADRSARGVVLLHLGAFDAVMLPDFLDLLEKRGVKLVTLAEAVVGIAAAARTEARSGSRPAPAARTTPDDTMPRLEQLCR